MYDAFTNIIKVTEAFVRMSDHLQANGVDFKQNLLTIGPPLRIDSDQERFIGSEPANALLSRKYRKPFVVPSESQI